MYFTWIHLYDKYKLTSKAYQSIHDDVLTLKGLLAQMNTVQKKPTESGTQQRPSGKPGMVTYANVSVGLDKWSFKKTLKRLFLETESMNNP